MPRHYIRLDPQFYERKALAQGYPLGAVAALVGCLCLGETQPERGHFRDRRVLGVLLGPAARWIPMLIERGDLVERDELPRLYIDGWDDWQEGDVTVPERMARMRAKKSTRAAAVTGLVTPDVTAPVTAHRQTASVEAVGADKDNSGKRPAVTNGGPTTRGYRPTTGPERLPGEAPNPKHTGQHPDCFVCGTAKPVEPPEVRAKPVDTSDSAAEAPEVSFDAPAASEEASSA